MTVTDAPLTPVGGLLTPDLLEAVLADVLSEMLGGVLVGPDSNFFSELGADSMVMTRFRARLRKRGGLPPVSMKDIYAHPTVRGLADALIPSPDAPAVESTRGTLVGVPAEAIERLVEDPAPAGPVRPAAPDPVGKPRYLLCGVLQLVAFFGMSTVAAAVLAQGFEWVAGRGGWVGTALRPLLAGLPAPVGATLLAPGLLGSYLRAVLYMGVSFVILSLLPIALKWLLVGRWKPARIRVWSLAYLRFWVVRSVLRTSPLMLFVGSPLYVMYLRALGARIGPGVAILSRQVPVCTDMLTIGEDTLIRKDASFLGYRARAGVIETGPITLGADVLVSESTVLDIHTTMGHWAQLGHASSLHEGQVVPHGESWHGSPAQPGEVDFRRILPEPCGSLRRAVFCAAQLVMLLAVTLPLSLGLVTLVVGSVPRLSGLLEPGLAALGSGSFYLEALTASYVLYFGSLALGLMFVLAGPRLLNLVVRPGRVHKMYGFRYGVHRAIGRMTNVRFFNRLFGDSSYVVGYLRSLGYGMRNVEQTGSNFGTDVKHDTPYLSSVGSGTMVADGLSVINADFTSTSFRVSPVRIGDCNFLGNRIAYPAHGRTGDNCLLATKVMVPIDGAVRRGVGLLGSPAFEIPRSVERDTRLDVKDPTRLRLLLGAKNRHNVITMGLYLAVHWVQFFAFSLLALAAADLYFSWHIWGIALVNVVFVVFEVVFWAIVDRSVRWLQALRPRGCSIYDRAFWRHERYWKICEDRYIQWLNGTPFKTLLWRSLGVRIGRRVFDDGASFTERSFTVIGDGCTLNAGSVVQCHSQEDGAFKSDCSTIGAGCTLGVNSFVHYGVTMGDGAELAADAFLMKGEDVPPGGRWEGNPARET